ncbi:MAG TPA: septal ring lytic transglycosylase RlpA family protein [Candidatus Saccharimonadales bacterium]|nr:septal ring lytic transglycosylase RlpA family protein [Candidatus Saccharimonadales bacterium]
MRIRRLSGALLGGLLMAAAAGCGHARGPVTSPERSGKGYSETGLASWYGPNYHGQSTASGERYNMFSMTAAHRTLPFGTLVRVTNLENGKAVSVTITDRGPFVKGRIVDLSYAAAKALEMTRSGVAKVRIEVIEEAGQ